MKLTVFDNWHLGDKKHKTDKGLKNCPGIDHCDICKEKKKMNNDDLMVERKFSTDKWGNTIIEQRSNDGKHWINVARWDKHHQVIKPEIKIKAGEKVTITIPKLDIKFDEPKLIHPAHAIDGTPGYIQCSGQNCALCDKKHEENNKKITGTTSIDELF